MLPAACYAIRTTFCNMHMADHILLSYMLHNAYDICHITYHIRHNTLSAAIGRDRKQTRHGRHAAHIHDERPEHDDGQGDGRQCHAPADVKAATEHHGPCYVCGGALREFEGVDHLATHKLRNPGGLVSTLLHRKDDIALAKVAPTTMDVHPEGDAARQGEAGRGKAGPGKACRAWQGRCRAGQGRAGQGKAGQGTP
jgi:hypothetical protein